METITYNDIQNLIQQLPNSKLPVAYRLLIELAEKDFDFESPQLNSMLLSLEERHKMLAKQAELMKIYYDQTSDERQEWQGGDFFDEYQTR
ncbi:hypothetical protein JW964_11490 [candidate division KSB1 bacterium]|jgi:hypothetical protein|nr:hypothetical protein [candidate division KSB1 bacterium]